MKLKDFKGKTIEDLRLITPDTFQILFTDSILLTIQIANMNGTYLTVEAEYETKVRKSERVS